MNLQNDQYWVTYLDPIRIITSDGHTPLITLDEINNCTYNHGTLCKIVGKFEVEYGGKTLDCLICGDGALAIKKRRN